VQWRSIGINRHHGAGSEVGGDTNDVGRVDSRIAHRSGDRHPKNFTVILRDLQSPVGREPFAPARDRVGDHGVRVFMDGAAHLAPVGYTHNNGASRQCAVVDADYILPLAAGRVFHLVLLLWVDDFAPRAFHSECIPLRMLALTKLGCRASTTTRYRRQPNRIYGRLAPGALGSARDWWLLLRGLCFRGRRSAVPEFEPLREGSAATTPVLVEDVEGDGKQKHEALDKLLVISSQPKDGHSVVENAHDEAANHGARNGAYAALDGGAAN